MSLIFAIIFCLALSAFFSGSEIAFISANKLGIALKQEGGSRKGKILTRFYKKPQKFLSMMLVGNNIALVAFTFFMTKLMEPFTQPILGNGMASLLFYTFIIAVIVLAFGEFLPKTYFRLYADKLIYNLAYPLSFFRSIFAFPTWLMTGMTNLLLKYVARVSSDRIENAFTRLDLEHYIDENLEDEDSIIDKELLTNALNLNNQRVRDCMIPRTEVVAIDSESHVEEAIKIFQETGLSRIIIMDHEIENTLGYIHHQQLFTKPQTLKSILLSVPFVPEAMNLKDLMLKFINDNVNIASVVDEYGSVSGIITLEDILEEIFGEIEDEHDEEAFTAIKVWDDEYLFSGRVEIDYINEKFPKLSFPEGEYQTISGYIVQSSGSIPEEGDEIELGRYKFVLETVSDTKIESVRVMKLSAKEEVQEQDDQ